MRKEDGYIKLWTKIRWSTLADLEPHIFKAFILLLCWCSYKTQENESMPLIPGQVWMSQRRLAADVFCCATSSVKGILESLEAEGLIKWQSLDRKGTLVTVVNWDKYQ